MSKTPVDAIPAHGFQAELQSLVRARYPLIHINTFEEDAASRWCGRSPSTSTSTC